MLGVDRARILPARAEPSYKYFGSSRAEPNEFLKIRAKTEPRSAGSASQCIAEPANLGSSRAELDFAEPITSRAKSEPGKTMAQAEPWLDPPLTRVFNCLGKWSYSRYEI